MPRAPSRCVHSPQTTGRYSRRRARAARESPSSRAATSLRAVLQSQDLGTNPCRPFCSPVDTPAGQCRDVWHHSLLPSSALREVLAARRDGVLYCGYRAVAVKVKAAIANKASAPLEVASVDLEGPKA